MGDHDGLDSEYSPPFNKLEWSACGRREDDQRKGDRWVVGRVGGVRRAELSKADACV